MYIQDPIISTSLQYLIHFIQYQVLEIIYYNTKVQSAELNNGNKITSSGDEDTRIHLCPPEESSTQRLAPQAAPATRVK
jgi:hypothetical protein